MPLHKVTIIQRGHSLGKTERKKKKKKHEWIKLGVTSFLPDKDIPIKTKKALMAELATAMGGKKNKHEWMKNKHEHVFFVNLFKTGRAAEELVFGETEVDPGK